MKKQSNKNDYAKVLKDKVDEIALDHGFCKDLFNPQTLQSNFRDPVLPLIISVYPTTGTVGISYCKEPFKWFKKCKLNKIRNIFENPLNYV